MKAWLEGDGKALWIYGIPGAGKTILSTLVVDEVLIRKRCPSIGAAYFYIRHDDKASHDPQWVLVSLIAQLARQNTFALARALKLLAVGEDYQLMSCLSDISQFFTDIYIMVDGLDECGPLYDQHRDCLLSHIADLHSGANASVRTLVFSRDEPDIRTRFRNANFEMVSIAASSADLRLFTDAWIDSLHVRNEALKVDILDTLVKEADGM